MKIVKIENSHIKGYHIFRVRPHPEIIMLVTPEANNPKDETAMQITMPKLDEIPTAFHDVVTRPRPRKKERETDQHVRDIAGRMVGRVPANLCRIFRGFLRNGFVEKIEW